MAPVRNRRKRRPLHIILQIAWRVGRATPRIKHTRHLLAQPDRPKLYPTMLSLLISSAAYTDRGILKLDNA